MLSFLEAIRDDWELTEYGHYRKQIGEHEICLEPLLFDDQFYFAIYDKDKNLVCPKIPIKPGKL